MKKNLLLSTLLLLQVVGFSQSNNEKFPASIYFGTGVAINSFEVTGDAGYYETQITHNVPASAAFVIGAKLYTDHKTARLFLAPRLSVYSFKADGTINLTSGTAAFNHTSSFRSRIIITPTANLGYHLVKTAFVKWHLTAGIGADFLVNATETQTTTYSNAPARIVENKPDPMVFVFSLGTGVDVGKNLTFWLHYLPPADITKYVNKKSRLSSIQAGIGWSFSNGK